MGLSPEQEKIWQSLTCTYEEPVVDEHPVMLRVAGTIETPADLLDAIDRNRMMITGEETELANLFFGIVWHSKDPKAAIAELPYEHEGDNMYIKLVFPKGEDTYGET